MKKTMNELYLLFVARQGYWDSIDKIRLRTFWKYVFPYLTVSMVLLIVFPLIQEDLFVFLRSQKIMNTFKYETIFFIILNIIIPMGLAYENFYVVKSNTPMTLKLFFNVTNTGFQLVLLIKNIILTLPIIVVSLYYSSLLTIWILLFTHIISQKISFFFIENRSIDVSSFLQFHYLLSIVDLVTILKSISISVLSMFIFYIFANYYPSILGLKFSTFDEILFSGTVLGTVFYANKGLPYFFLSLINDIPYLRSLGLDIYRFLNKQILLILFFSYIVTILPLLGILIVLQFTLLDILVFSLGVLLGYLVIQGIQMRDSLLFQHIHFKNVQELEMYSFSLKQHLCILSSRFYLLVFFLSYRFFEKYSNLLVDFIFIILLIFVFVLNHKNTLVRYAGIQE